MLWGGGGGGGGGGLLTCDGTVSFLGSGWLSFTYVHHGNWGWALALCTSWQGEGFNLHVHIFHYKGNNSGDGLTSPVTTGTVVLYISGWYSGNVVDFREQKCQHDYYLSHTAARVLDDQASLSTFLLAVWTFKSKSNTYN